MVIHAYGGLANRLRVLLSYRASGHTAFRWDADGEIAGAFFGDVFAPLDGVTFVSGGAAEKRTCDPDLASPSDWQNSYRDLRLHSLLRAQFDDFRPPEPYGAIHVRRSDHTAYARELHNETPDSEFAAWLVTAPECVYLATDNGTTQLQYMKAIRESDRECFVYDGIHEHERQDVGGVRNTTLAHAAIDLFICAGAEHFKGTRESSFSDAVTMLHALGGWWS